MDAKELVTAYYKSNAFGNPEVADRFIHSDIVMEWRSSKGFLQLNKIDILELISGLKKAYSSYRLDIGHIIADGNKACARYTHYVHAFENPDEEVILGHFVAVWEIKDNKLYRGYLMSQLD
ncbi:nuclear transport factor 2 family protein [Flavobacterium salilacus subsp. salilacus]|uniref:nuclear transport factor 2 family protein n=1 Tax=Flavobacterium TaxID=237 RepID=UPI0010757C0C|nr:MULTISPECIES: nuclear transport factor 2 family protein [Flavobacterium]KAF2518693.1 nuclear transport factor 2 family protein [Flavobacterium salilacus subsp. salilacus]MBE1613657.1 nuclear transport factor 2 family protein [Flavobacterium sp. SaA2.13]